MEHPTVSFLTTSTTSPASVCITDMPSGTSAWPSRLATWPFHGLNTSTPG
ncbi:hypothetical protein WJ971_28565 [Achromobacter xylosoxidans]